MSEHEELIKEARQRARMFGEATAIGSMIDELATALESLPTPPVAGEPTDLIEEFSFDYEPMPGLKYVTTNVMMAETMAAAKPGAKVLRRMAPKWEATS